MSNASKNEYDINNDEQLREHYHSIHNLIRNKFSQYGKSALAIFNFIFGLKLLEPLIINGKIKLSKKCLFSDMLKLDPDDLVTRVGDVIEEIYDSKSIVKDALFVHLPFEKFKIKDDALGEVFRRINAIDTDKFDVGGKNYEYFLGFITGKNKGSKSGSQIDDLGQYFTDRKIVKYVMAKVDPQLDTKFHVQSMTDTFCGSCGFVTEYIRYLNINNGDIDWEKEIKNIYACDTDDSIIKSGRIELMSLTGTIPYKLDEEFKIKESNVEWKNSFADSFEKRKFKYYLTNPPYGGDKGKNEDDKVCLKNANEEIKHVAKTGCIRKKNDDDYAKYLITGDNKETLSLILGMALLDDDGTYAGVLKEGIFFDKKFSNLRKHLVDNYKVEWVISVPQDAFENTSTKTSILIFRNKQPVYKNYCINFCELSVEKNNKDEVITINEINPQTKKIIQQFEPFSYKWKEHNQDYMCIQYDEIVKNNYSLNHKNYIKENIKVNKGFKLVKLGDILKYKSKSKRKAADENEKGIYRFYTSSDKIKKCDFLDYPKELSLIFGTGGKGSLFLDDNFSCSADNFVCTTVNDETTTYLYYYIKNNWEKFINKLFNGSTLGHINKENLNKYEIPIPEDINTVKLYLDVLNPCNESLQSLQSQKEKSICGLIKLLTTMGEKGVDYDEYKLGDVCEFNPKPEKITGNFVEYLDIGNCLEFKTERLNNDKNLPSRAKRTAKINDVLLSSVRPNNKNINVITKSNYKENLLLSTGFIIMRPLKVIPYYLYFYVLRDDVTNYLISKSTGSGYPAISSDDVKNVIILVLKPHIIKQYKLDEEFEFMDKLRDSIQTTLKHQEEATKQMMKLVLETSKKNNNSHSKELNCMNNNKLDTEIQNNDENCNDSNDIENINNVKNIVEKRKESGKKKSIIVKGKK